MKKMPCEGSVKQGKSNGKIKEFEQDAVLQGICMSRQHSYCNRTIDGNTRGKACVIIRSS